MHRDGQPTGRLSARRDRKGAREEVGGRALPNNNGVNQAIAERRAAEYTVTTLGMPATKPSHGQAQQPIRGMGETGSKES